LSAFLFDKRDLTQLSVQNQIVLLFTKAVSDFFGGGGMSDQMIKFNGFPFLEKEDKEAADPAYLEPSESNPSGVRPRFRN